MGESIVIPTDRDVRATLERPDRNACVVACPPHPEMGGSRTDGRLRAVCDALEAGCLRFDYGPWDEGRGELADARAAVAFARERYDRVGIFGYSFGGTVAVVAAADESRDRRPPVAVSALAPAATVGELDAVSALDRIDAPRQIVYGQRDTTADWEPIVDRARELGATVEAVGADHFFVGQTETVGEAVGRFLGKHL